LFEFLTKQDYQEMGLMSVVVMHDPFISNGPRGKNVDNFLSVNSDWLARAQPTGSFHPLDSYAFIASQKVIKSL
jgi:hypothetical protein